MENVSFAMAFMAGLLSFLSPCILPLIPAYLGFLTGNAVSALVAQDAKANLMLKAFGFVFGFSLIFIIMGASASKLGQLFAEYKFVLTKVGGAFNYFLRHSFDGTRSSPIFVARKKAYIFYRKEPGSWLSLYRYGFCYRLDSVYWTYSGNNFNLRRKYGHRL